MAIGYYHAPVGILELHANDEALIAVNFLKGEKKKADENDLITHTKEQLIEFFNQSRREFDIPLDFSGTEFQMNVWKKVQEIPFGQFKSYSALTQSLGARGAVRAVASAVGKNPLPILIPCHRILGKNGKLRGYIGGLPAKKHLIELEQYMLF